MDGFAFNEYILCKCTLSHCVPHLPPTHPHTHTHTLDVPESFLQGGCVQLPQLSSWPGGPGHDGPGWARTMPWQPTTSYRQQYYWTCSLGTMEGDDTTHTNLDHLPVLFKNCNVGMHSCAHYLIVTFDIECCFSMNLLIIWCIISYKL